MPETLGGLRKAGTLPLARRQVRCHRPDSGKGASRKGKYYFAALETALPADDTSFPAPWIVLQAASVVSVAMMMAVVILVFMTDPVIVC